jgi:hypothetical protein
MYMSICICTVFLKKRNMYMSLDFKRCIVYSPLPVCLKIVTLYCFQIYSNLSLFSYTQPHEKKERRNVSARDISLKTSCNV